MKSYGQGSLVKKIFSVTGLTMALLAPMYIEAARTGDQPYSQREMEMLPEYCRYTQIGRRSPGGGTDVETMSEWYKIMGGSYPSTGPFHTMHHYCTGLLNMFAAKLARTPAERAHEYRTAVSEISYVIERAEPTFIMLPEIYTKLGESLLGLGNSKGGIEAYNRAIELKRDYWPPYAALSDYFKSLGNIKLAREYLQQGLEAAPDTKALTRRLAELDSAKAKPRAAAESPAKTAAPKDSTEETAAPPSAHKTATPKSSAKQ